MVTFGPGPTLSNFDRGWLDWISQLGSTQLNTTKFWSQPTWLNITKFHLRSSKLNTIKFGSGLTRPNFDLGRLNWIRLNFDPDYAENRLEGGLPSISCWEMRILRRPLSEHMRITVSFLLCLSDRLMPHLLFHP